MPDLRVQVLYQSLLAKFIQTRLPRLPPPLNTIPYRLTSPHDPGFNLNFVKYDCKQFNF